MQALVGDYNRIYSLPADFLELTRSIRMTASQRIQLESACRKYYALGGGSLAERLDRQKVRSIKELLAQVESLAAAL
jgi:hypothetical protein